jgi:cation:H+ antiporter
MAPTVTQLRHPLTAIALVVALTLPWLLLRVTGRAGSVPTLGVIALSGIAVLGAAFILTWGAETAEKDVPREFALAVLAIIAVAPEYAVDALYAWEAGVNPGSPASINAANLAVANMTGANRILIGLGWAGIAMFAIYRALGTGDTAVEDRDGFLADALQLDPRVGTELLFLAIATVYAFFIPFGGGIGAIDAIVLVGLYVGYITLVLQGEEVHEETMGVPRYLQGLARRRRILTVLVLFAYAALIILIAVKPFAKGLETFGPRLGVSSFFMIQWVAPLASESPEFIATAYLVTKARSTAAYTALISSKLNQWTLLIGTLVVVYSLSLGYYDVLSFNQKQAGEIWLTAAQSFFAVVLVMNLEISVREAVGLLALFVLQFIPAFQTYEGLLAFSGVYIALGLGLLWTRREHLSTLTDSARRRANGEV